MWIANRNTLTIFFLIVFISNVFWPAYRFDFVWDDDVNIIENPYLSPPHSQNLLQFWKGPYQDLYIPLTYSLWGIGAQLSTTSSGKTSSQSLSPHIFHLLNIILHLLSAIVVFLILKLLLFHLSSVDNQQKIFWAAGSGALLFAIHPVQVEPVVWISGLKGVLSGFLSLLATWQYVIYSTKSIRINKSGIEQLDDKPSNHFSQLFFSNFLQALNNPNYIFASIFFVLAILAKPTAIVVPVVALVIDRFIIKKRSHERAPVLICWMALAVPFMILTKWLQPDTTLSFVSPLWTRPIVAFDAIAFYFYKLFFPLWLYPDYGRTPEMVLQFTWYYYIAVSFSVIVFFILLRKHKIFFAASSIFVACLLPVSGLIPFLFQNISTVADRYLYFSMLGPAIAISYSVVSFRSKFFVIFCIFILSLFSIKTSFQIWVWKDEITLFKHTLNYNLRSYISHNNIGVTLLNKGKSTEAVTHFMSALKIKPSSASANNNLGNALVSLGKNDDAIKIYEEALRINPGFLKAHNNLGVALAKRGEMKKSIKHFSKALLIDSENTEAHVNLGNALKKMGNLDMAIKHYEAALKINNFSTAAHYNLGNTFFNKTQFNKAVIHYSKALKINPNFSAARKGRQKALKYIEDGENKGSK